MQKNTDIINKRWHHEKAKKDGETLSLWLSYFMENDFEHPYFSTCQNNRYKNQNQTRIVLLKIV